MNDVASLVVSTVSVIDKMLSKDFSLNYCVVHFYFINLFSWATFFSSSVLNTVQLVVVTVFRFWQQALPTSEFHMIFLCSGVISLASNIVVLLMFVKFKELRTATNFIIINLAFTDIGVAGIGYPMSAASDIHGSWKFGYTGCQVGAVYVASCVHYSNEWHHSNYQILILRWGLVND